MRARWDRGRGALVLAAAGAALAWTAVGAAAQPLWNHSFIDDPRPPDERRTLHRMSGTETADLVAYLRSLGRRR